MGQRSMIGRAGLQARVAFGAALLLGALVSAPASAQQGRYLFDVVKREPYRGAYAALTAPMIAAQPWMDKAGGVASPGTTLRIDGAAYQLYSLCKPHDCGDNMLMVLFSADGRRAVGAFRTPEGTRYLGAPDAGQRQALDAAFDAP